MPRTDRCLSTYLFAVAWTAIAFQHSTTVYAAPVELPGYSSYAEMERELTKLAKSNYANLISLGQTDEGRQVHMLSLSAGDSESKPAVLVMGSARAANLVGSELAVRMARRLIKNAESKEEESLLDEVTFYIVPRPSPDASERAMTSGRPLNSRKVDADRDGQTDEDPDEDLNGDGVITSMRVSDPSGPWRAHPDDPRVLIRADKGKNETGQFQLYSEGRDNDEDESWNEDGPGGVDFNRNFTFQYPYFAGDAGPHQVSEPESRALVDFAMSRRNIFLVFSFAPQDNLTKPWKSSSDSGGRIKTQVLKADAPYYKFIAQLYDEEVGKKNAPETAGNEGAFVPWAYYHYGRWSLGTRGWWIPKTDGNDEGDEETKKDDAETGDTKEDKPEKSKEEEKRGRDDINALAWFAKNNMDGFVPWAEVDHPDFPGQRVEVGGFKPLLREHPPANQLDAISEKHRAFLAKVVDLRARLEFEPAKLERLGPGVYRLTAAVLNTGYLPTASAMGQTSRQLQRVDLELTLPDGAVVVTGFKRHDLGVIAGNGGRAEKSWLLRLPNQDRQATLKLRAGEPSVGFCELEISTDDAM